MHLLAKNFVKKPNPAPPSRVYAQEHNETIRLRAEIKEREQQFGNLLARMHRDGGHYINKVGWKQAGLDAEQIYLDLRMQIESYKSCNGCGGGASCPPHTHIK